MTASSRKRNHSKALDEALDARNADGDDLDNRFGMGPFDTSFLKNSRFYAGVTRFFSENPQVKCIEGVFPIEALKRFGAMYAKHMPFVEEVVSYRKFQVPFSAKCEPLAKLAEFALSNHQKKEPLFAPIGFRFIVTTGEEEHMTHVDLKHVLCCGVVYYLEMDQKDAVCVITFTPHESLKEETAFQLEVGCDQGYNMTNRLANNFSHDVGIGFSKATLKPITFKLALIIGGILPTSPAMTFAEQKKLWPNDLHWVRKKCKGTVRIMPGPEYFADGSSEPTRCV